MVVRHDPLKKVLRVPELQDLEQCADHDRRGGKVVPLKMDLDPREYDGEAERRSSDPEIHCGVNALLRQGRHLACAYTQQDAA